MGVAIRIATDPQAWDAFLAAQPYRPFLQSWTMGDVYKDIGQEPIRLVLEEDGKIVGLCYAHIVPARRGRHLSVPYGPVLGLRESDMGHREILDSLFEELKKQAKERKCSFIRISPFWNIEDPKSEFLRPKSAAAPLHLLAEHIWYLPLTTEDPWTSSQLSALSSRSPDDLFKDFRATHRNLIRRAEKEGVTIERSKDPVADLEHFIRLHDETRKRHKFTPYSNAFFRAQVSHFSKAGMCTVYLAKYQGMVIAASVHMHAFGETSYHHGASDSAHHKIPASYLLQWTAIQDALKRGDQIYNFWGVAPLRQEDSGQWTVDSTNHPFKGVTTFKTGFSGKVLNLTHCVDIPVAPSYWLTNLFERLRKWKRGF